MKNQDLYKKISILSELRYDLLIVFAFLKNSKLNYERRKYIEKKRESQIFSQQSLVYFVLAI